jgi:hypothetical protein
MWDAVGADSSGEQRDCPTGKSLTCLSRPLRKNIPLRVLPKSIHIASRPAPTEGRFAIVTDVRRDAVDAEGAGDVGA